MRRPIAAALLLVALGLIAGPVAHAQNQSLTHDDYDRWEEIEAQSISDDGAWVLYRTSPPKGDDTLQVKRVDPRRTHEIPRGERARFTADAQFVLFMFAPPHDSTRQTRLDDVSAPKRPTADLAEMRDWTTRMQQLFDHYLKDAPAPVWLKEGVPAVENDRTLRLEPVTGTSE